jgi:hypothetical protein
LLARLSPRAWNEWRHDWSEWALPHQRPPRAAANGALWATWLLMGVRVLRDPYSAKPYVLFYVTKRVGGGVADFDAIKLLKFAAPEA